VERKYTHQQIQEMTVAERWDSFGEYGMDVVGKFSGRIFAKDVSLTEAARHKREIDAAHRERVAKMAAQLRREREEQHALVG
jgi:hypothetical protein